MPKAIRNGQIIAEAPSNGIHRVGEYIYFPPSAVRRDFLHPVKHIRPSEGRGELLRLYVDGKVNTDAAWYYHEPSVMAARVKDYIAFCHGVQVEE